MSGFLPRTMAVVLSVTALTGGCDTGGSGPTGSAGGRPFVVASFYPLVFAAEGVGGDLVEVENLTASGVEPHDLELSADQVGSLSEADLTVFLGGGFQPAVEDVVSGLDESRVLRRGWPRSTRSSAVTPIRPGW